MILGKAINMLGSVITKDGAQGIKNILLAFTNLCIKPLKMSSAPVFIQIEPTTYCNLECQMCANPLGTRSKRHMAFNEFKRILDNFPFVRKISLVGLGEPLLNPDLFSMISYAKSKGINIGFATNGTLLNDENCRKIIDSRLDWINVSLDSPDKKRFEMIRKGARFDLVIENIKRLLKAKADKAIPEISLWFVIMKDNLKNLPLIIKFAKNIGIKQVSAQLEHFWGDAQIQEGKIVKELEENIQSIKNMLMITKKEAKHNGVNFEYVNIPDTASGRSCAWPWKSCYVTCEGFITPCCLHGFNPKNINFGNVLNENFKDIWNNLAYQDFRKLLKSKTPPSICLGCTGYFGRLEV